MLASRPQRGERTATGPPASSHEESHVRRRMMKSKVHRATVTEANLHDVWSITLDPSLVDIAAELADLASVHEGAR